MLVHACLNGDPTAFATLVDRYQGPLYNATYRITGSVDDALDATQAAFTSAYEKLHTFDPSHRFFSWIYRIAVNQALNIVSRRRPQAPLDPASAIATDDPDRALGEAESTRAVHEALQELSDIHRTVIVLKHLQGLSYREISDVLDIPETTVKSRLFDARRRLRTVLHEQGWL